MQYFKENSICKWMPVFSSILPPLSIYQTDSSTLLIWALLKVVKASHLMVFSAWWQEFWSEFPQQLIQTSGINHRWRRLRCLIAQRTSSWQGRYGTGARTLSLWVKASCALMLGTAVASLPDIWLTETNARAAPVNTQPDGRSSAADESRHRSKTLQKMADRQQSFAADSIRNQFEGNWFNHFINIPMPPPPSVIPSM